MMIDRAKLGGLLFLSLVGCSQPRNRIIEPKSAGGGQELALSERKSVDDDAAFTLSRKPTKAGDPQSPQEYPIHLADKWFPFRAEYLKVTPQQAMARDQELSEIQAPPTFWDEQTAIEAVSVWGGLCNECHGGRRRLKEALVMPAPTAGWGKGEGLFFGKRRRYNEVFKTIYTGGPIRNGKESEMPAWRTRLSKEQIWSLIYFLEYQSGGIEGVFPPSLYPRPLDETGGE